MELFSPGVVIADQISSDRSWSLIEIYPLLLLALAANVIWMGLWLLPALRRRDMGWVDAGWASGVGITALMFACLAGAPPWRAWAVGGLALLWSGRLAGLILRRVAAAPAEDGRYRALRARWGASARRAVPLLFFGEAPLITLFALPILIALRNPAPQPTVWDAAGLFLGLAAVAGEALADRQLAAHRARPENRGRTCRVGLWRYSRHPNYFFEWLHWWAYVLLAVGAPQAWLAWLGPLLMFAFLYRVTGIPHTERQALASRGEDYRRYQATTSAFVPWFPRKEPAS